LRGNERIFPKIFIVLLTFSLRQFGIEISFGPTNGPFSASMTTK